MTKVFDLLGVWSPLVIFFPIFLSMDVALLALLEQVYDDGSLYIPIAMLTFVIFANDRSGSVLRRLILIVVAITFLMLHGVITGQNISSNGLPAGSTRILTSKEVYVSIIVYALIAFWRTCSITMRISSSRTMYSFGENS